MRRDEISDDFRFVESQIDLCQIKFKVVAIILIVENRCHVPCHLLVSYENKFYLEDE